MLPAKATESFCGSKSQIELRFKRNQVPHGTIWSEESRKDLDVTAQELDSPLSAALSSVLDLKQKLNPQIQDHSQESSSRYQSVAEYFFAKYRL